MGGLTAKTRLGLGVIAAALALGALGDGLLRATPWGLNVALWVAALVGAAALLAWWGGLELRGGGRWLVLPALCFASVFVWRDSPALKFLNGSAALGALALAAYRARAGRVRVAGVAEWAFGGVLVGLEVAFGAILLVAGDVRWRELARGERRGWLGPAGATARGALLALPPLLVFGALFMSADAVFEGVVMRLFRFDVAAIVSHGVAIGFLAWGVAGLLRAAFLATDWPEGPVERALPLSLGIIEFAIVLGLLNALFGAFVLVQLRYFFGGAGRVLASSNLTYAEYARRGFFELVAVAALVVPLLLLAHWLVRGASPAQERVFRALAGLLLALLAVVMASALGRMRLYQSVYGLTELRLYTTAFMGWLALTLLWFAATVLRGRRDRFAFGALVAGFLVLAALDAANPDAIIARTNAARGGDGGVAVDARYVTSLSADAVPALIAALPALDPDARAAVAAGLLRDWSPPAGRDWRSWNWGRERAWRAVAANEAELRALVR